MSGNPQPHDPNELTRFASRDGGAAGDAGLLAGRPPVLEVRQVWQDLLMDVRHYGPGGRSVTVGSGAGGRRSDFEAPAEDLPGEGFALFRQRDGGWVFNFDGRWEGFADLGEERITFRRLVDEGRARRGADGLFELPVEGATCVVADTGHVVYLARLTAPGKRVAGRLRDGVDYPFLGMLSFMLFLFAMAATVVATSPAPADSEVVQIPDRFVELMLRPPEPSAPDPVRPEPQRAEGARAKEKEGRVGKKDETRKLARGDRAKVEKRQLDQEIASGAGVLGALREGATWTASSAARRSTAT